MATPPLVGSGGVWASIGPPKKAGFTETFEDTAGGVAVLRDRAQGLVEYGLILALVVVVAVAGLIALGPALKSMLSHVGASV